MRSFNGIARLWVKWEKEKEKPHKREKREKTPKNITFFVSQNSVCRITYVEGLEASAYYRKFDHLRFSTDPISKLTRMLCAHIKHTRVQTELGEWMIHRIDSTFCAFQNSSSWIYELSNRIIWFAVFQFWIIILPCNSLRQQHVTNLIIVKEKSHILTGDKLNERTKSIQFGFKAGYIMLNFSNS